LAKIGLSLDYTERLLRYIGMKKAATAEPDQAKAAALAEETLAWAETLLAEIRGDRQKWDGVVSPIVAAKNVYLGRDVAAWREAMAKGKTAAAGRP
jgi:hypothetical protein